MKRQNDVSLEMPPKTIGCRMQCHSLNLNYFNLQSIRPYQMHSI